MAQAENGKPVQVERYRRLNKAWWTVITVAGAMAITIAIGEIFNLIHAAHVEHTYYFAILALLLSPCFIILPASKGAPRDKVPWYDVLLFIIAFVGFTTFAAFGLDITIKGWVYTGPLWTTILSLILWASVLEVLRRAGGMAVFSVSVILSVFPLFASHAPGFLEGTQWTLFIGHNSLLGITTAVFSNLVLGFILFGVVLVVSGAGDFFLKLAFAVFGSVRGGAAKVSVFSSALFGMLSGVALSNIVTTGSVTIPTMKKAGYPPYYAGAVEAAASTGGIVTPPVMGAVAFIMASFLNMHYASIIIIAAVPAILYYVGIFVQVDGHAARNGLVGLTKDQLPSLKQTLKEGWIYGFAIVAFMYLLFALKQEAQAPFVASALLIVAAMFRKETRFTPKKFLHLCHEAGKTLAELIGVLAAIGLIIGGLAMTGVGIAFSSGIVALSGGNAIVILILAAIASFILGMGMPISACYVFLSIVVIPALVTGPSGMVFDVVAVHFFVLWCGLWSMLTPPVALSSFLAAQIAGANFFKTSFQSLRLVFTAYIIPFAFVLNPSLILRGSLLESLQTIPTALLGVFLTASGIEGYFVRLGHLKVLQRILFIAAGVLLILPESSTDLAGIGLLAVLLIVHFVRRGPESLRGAEVGVVEEGAGSAK